VSAALFLPLITADRLIGLVAAGQTGRTRQFTAGEVDLAMSLANQVAIAATNARLQEKMQPRLLELATINRICLAISRVTNLAQLCDAIVTEVGGTLEAETLVLALFDATSQAVSFPLLFAGGQLLSSSPQAPAGPLAYIIQSRRPLRLNGQIEAQLHELGATYQPLLAGGRVPQSYLGVPLLLNNRVVGVIAVEDEKMVGKFNQSHEFILTTVAPPIALAVENARLQVERDVRASELAERTTQLALINRLSAALIGNLEVEPILRLTLDELRVTLGVDHAGALLLDSTGGLTEPALISMAPSGNGQPEKEALVELVQALRTENGALLIADVANDDRVKWEQLAWLGPDVRTVLLLPLVVNERLAGLVGLAHDATGRPFSAAEIELAATCVNQAASAIASARLFEAARQSKQTAQAKIAQFVELADISNSLASAMTTAAVVAATLKALVRALPYDSLTFYRYRPAEAGTAGRLNVIGAAGPAGAPIGQRLDLGAEPFLAEVLRGQMPVVVSDAHNEARMLANPTQSALGAGGWMGIPLIHRDQAAGLIVIAKAEPDCYQAGHVAIAQAIAGQVAAALDQAEQFEATNEHARTLEAERRRLALLNRVADDIFRTLELHDILRRALTAMVESAGVEQAAALVFADPSAGQPGPVLVQYPAQDFEAVLPPAGNPIFDRFQQPEMRRAFIIGDAAEQLKPAHVAWIGREVKSAVFLPLTSGETWFGIIGLGQNSPRSFNEAEIELLQKLTEQLAVAAANARQHSQTEAALQEQSTYNRIARTLSRANDLAQIQSVLQAEFSNIAGVETWYLVLQSASSDKVSFAAVIEKGQPRQVKATPPLGVIQYILQHGQPLQLDGDIGSRLKELGLPHRGSRARLEAGDPSAAKAYVGVPVMVDEHAIGVLAIENAERGDAFVERHLHLMQAIAELLATAIQRVRRHEQSEQTGRQLSEYRGLYEQSSQSTEGLVRQLKEQTAALAHLQAQHGETARETEALQGQLSRQAEAVRGWRERLAVLLDNHEQPFAPRALDSVLSQELLIGCRALGAEAGAVYLWQPAARRLANPFVYGLAEALPAGVDHEAGLIGAVLQSRQPIVVGDLTTDPRWIGQAHTAEGPTAAGARTNGAATEHEATIETHATGAANGYYRSALVMPLMADEQAVGAVLFLSARPQAFDEAILPVARATASQIAFAIRATTEAADLRHQIEAMQQLIAEGPTSAGVPINTAGHPIARQTVALAEPGQAGLEPATPSPVEQGASPAPAAWRRLALPAVALLVIVCLAAAAIGNAGTIKQAASAFLGGAAATATGAGTRVDTLAATSAQTNAGAASATGAPATNIVLRTPTIRPTATATATPKPTNTTSPSATPLPSAVATVPLPADVIAVARVVLPEGVVGRLRDGPNGSVIGGVTGNTLVHVLRGRQTTSDGLAWVPIRMPDTGQSGWLAESLLKYMPTPTP
jgi:GAF domain-containing protein